MRLSDRVSVLPNVKSNTHHISLSDGKNTLGFVVSDSNGNPALNNLSMNPNKRTAVKVTSGVQKWVTSCRHGCRSLKTTGKADEVRKIMRKINRSSIPTERKQAFRRYSTLPWRITRQV